jgi:hypothetical protein
MKWQSTFINYSKYRSKEGSANPGIEEKIRTLCLHLRIDDYVRVMSKKGYREMITEKIRTLCLHLHKKESAREMISQLVNQLDIIFF